MILVSGGTGMLGAHLLYSLTTKHEEVRALKRSTSNIELVKRIFSYYTPLYNQLFEKIEWFNADVLNKKEILKVMEGIDFVYHAAAMVSFSPKVKEKMISSNIKGTQNMVNAALIHNVKKFCHVSSISALGDASKGEFVTEESFRSPSGKYSGYSISKYLSELEVWRGITEGLNAVIVNPSIILGPGDWRSGSPSIFSNIHKGLNFYTEGVTGYVDVFDVVEAMIQLMESDYNNERYIISAENRSFKDVFCMVADALEVNKPSIKASSFMLALAWRLEAIKNIITGKEPKVTKDSAYSAQKKVLFSSKKLIDALNFKYTPIKECITRIAQNYKG